MQFEMLEKRILPSADLPIAPQALQLIIDPQQIAAVSVAYDVQIMKAAQAAQVDLTAATPVVQPTDVQKTR